MSNWKVTHTLSLPAPASQASRAETRTPREITSSSAMQDVSEAPSISEQCHTSSRMEDLDMLGLGPESPGYATYPFNWAVMDVSGSTGLLRLCEALEIEFSILVPSSLDTRIPEESQYISGAEIPDLWNG